MPSSFAAAAAFFSAVSCVASGFVCPGAQIAVERIAFRPASRSEVHVRLGADEGGLLDRVLGRAHEHARPARRRGGRDEKRGECRPECESPFHDPV